VALYDQVLRWWEASSTESVTRRPKMHRFQVNRLPTSKDQAK